MVTSCGDYPLLTGLKQELMQLLYYNEYHLGMYVLQKKTQVCGKIISVLTEHPDDPGLLASNFLDGGVKAKLRYLSLSKLIGYFNQIIMNMQLLQVRIIVCGLKSY